jgi:intracellular multiplication protein IcmT
MVKVVDITEQIHWHWRNTMRPIRFFSLDAKAATPFFVLLFFPRLSTLLAAIVITSAFMFLENRGLTFDAAMRSLRVVIFGDNRPALMTFRYRKLKDYG